MAGAGARSCLALALCAGLSGASSGRQRPPTLPGSVDEGETAVKCGRGTLVEWYASEGDFVAPGSPVCEICQPAADGLLTQSVTCYSAANGAIIAAQPLRPGESLYAKSENGVVAVVQRQFRTLKGIAVRCAEGARFQRIIVQPGERVRTGQAVALAQGASGEAVACRAPSGGRLVAGEPGHGRGRHSHDGRAVAWIQPEPPKGVASPTKTSYQLANPAPCLVVLVASGVRSETVTSAEVAVLQTSVAEVLDVGASDVVISSISDLLDGASITLETTKLSEAQPRKPEDVANHLEEAISRSLEELASPMTVSVRSLRLSPSTPALVRTKHHTCGRHSTSPALGHSSLRHERHENAGVLEAPQLHGEGDRAPDELGHGEESPAIGAGSGALKAGVVLWPLLLAVVAGSLCYYFRASRSKRSLYRSVAKDEFFADLEEPDWTPRPPVLQAIVEFEEPGSRRYNIHFNHSDHGMVLSEQTPGVVSAFRFNSCALSLGVQIGWRIVQVAGQPVLSTDHTADVYELLAVRLRHLPVWPLRIEFDAKGNGVQCLDFSRQPLGIELSEEAPVSTKTFKPDSYAEIRGVEVGWAILRVGNMLVRPNTSAAEVAEWLEKGSAHLPQESGGLPVIFIDHEGENRTLNLRRQPVGIIFSRTAPVSVQGFEFNSYAREMGVQVGWQPVCIGSQDISPKTSPEDVEQHLRAQAAHLAPWPLRIDFLTPTDDIKSFYVDRQPLGVDFTRTAPFRISCFKPDSPALGLKWKVGWTALRVGNGLLSSDTAYDVFMRYLDMGLAHLPPAPPGGVAMLFVDPFGKARSLQFHRQPFGMIFDESYPTTVSGFPFNSYARDLGVRPGWQLVRADRHDARACASSVELLELLRGLQAGLPPWPVRMDFLDIRDELQILFFDRQPLGLEFTRDPAVQVSALKPDSNAGSWGVCPGWRLLRAGDATIALDEGDWGGGCREVDPEELLGLLDKEVVRLPQVPRGLMVEFADKESRPRAVYFLRRPLGLRLVAVPSGEGAAGAAGTAAEVAGFDFNSYAKDMGVQVGWRVLRVGREAAAPWPSAESLCGLLRAQEAEWPPWPLRMDFEPDDGSAVQVCFLERRHLGLELSGGMPPRISSIDPAGSAGAFDLRPGWKVVRVGDVVVGQDMDREQLLAYIGVGSAHLPL